MPLFVRQHNVLVANDAGLCVVHYALLIHSAYLRDEVLGIVLRGYQGRRRTSGHGSGAVFLVNGIRNVPPEIPLDTPSRMRDQEWRFLTAVEVAHTGLQCTSMAGWPEAGRCCVRMGALVTNGTRRPKLVNVIDNAARTAAGFSERYLASRTNW